MARKTTRNIIGALCLLTAGIGAYLFYSIEIFSPVNLHFSQAQQPDYRPMNRADGLLCYQSAQKSPEVRQKQFRLLVWNMHKGQDHGWQQALERLSQHADFLLLQEVTDRQNLATQYSSQFPSALYASAFAYLQQQSGVEILSKFTPHFYCAGSQSEPWIRIPKVGVAMNIPLTDGKDLLLVNVHLINFELNPTAYGRQLRNLMQLVNRHQGPIILAGDFNSWNGYRMSFIRDLSREYDLREVDFQPDHRLRFFGSPLDHVFVRGLDVLNAATEPTESSDHAPLLLEVELAD